MTKRQKAILKRNLFLGFCAAILILFICLVVFIISALTKDKTDDTASENSSVTSSQESETTENSSENTSSEQVSSAPQKVEINGVTLDANYSNLLLVNGKNPLPADHDYNANLIVAPISYKKGSTDEVYRKFNKDIWPYLKAMMDDARADGIDIGIISAWRSYDTQRILFDDKVSRLKSQGYSQTAAEKEAATCIALPGTSEHHTGLAVDFNVTQASFENTKTFKWLKENAENYGFILRYPNDKMEITGGIIYEPWHWRFVGINTAKEINRLGMCLEEYVEYKS